MCHAVLKVEVITLLGLVSICLLQVKICILFVMWPHKTTPFMCHSNLSVEAWSTWKFGDHKNSDSQEEKYFIKYMNLINTYYHWKTELIG